LAAFATVASWAFLVLAPNARQLGQALRLPYVLLMVVWVLWTGAMVPNALDPERAWTIWSDGSVKTLTMFLFVLGFLVSLASVRALMAVQILGAATLTFFYVKGGFPLWGTPVPMYDVNDLALHLNMALPMVLFFAMSIDGRRIRVGLWVLAVFVAVSILMTESRGGFLTLGILFTALWVGARGIKIWMRLVPAIALIVGFFFLPEPVQDRLSTLFSLTEDYNYTEEQGRVEIWKRGLGYLSDHPLTGVGIANFPVAEQTLSDRALYTGTAPARVTHNSFLQVAAETGIPGFLLYLGAFLTAFHRLGHLRGRLKRVRNSPVAGELALMSGFLFMSLLAFCVGGFFLSLGYTPVLFSVIALIAGFDIHVSRWLREASTRSASPVVRPGWGSRTSGTHRGRAWQSRTLQGSPRH
jgi:probable O-glycosylation ligase (exosortase A-associated)